MEHDVSPAAESGTPEPLADQLLDDLLPESLEWRRLVCTYPVTSLCLAGAAGFFLGRNHGSALLAAVSAFAVREVSDNIASVFGEAMSPEGAADAD